MNKNKLVVAIGTVVLIGIIVLMLGRQKLRTEKGSNGIVNIGVILPLTGAQAQDGNEILNSLSLACDMLNQKRDEKINLLVADSKDSPKEAITAFNKLLQHDPIAFIIGGSTVAMTIAPLGEKYEVPIIGLLASDEALAKINEWTFRFFPLDMGDAATMAKFAKEKLGVKTASILWVNNTQGDEFSKYLTKEFERVNGKVLYSECYDIGAVNLKSEVEKAMSFDVDAIYVFGYGTGFVTCFNTLAQAHYRGKVLSWAPFSLPFNLAALSQSSEGVYYTAPRFDKSDSATTDYYNRYVKKFSKVPGYIGAFGYESLLMMSPALSQGIKSKELRDYIMGIADYDSIVGRIGFYGSKGLMIRPSIWKIENGSPRLLQ